MHLVQLPRGRTAAVHFNPVTGCVTTSHAGLIGTLFRKGVADFEGYRRFPGDGRKFISAVYDYLFLRNYVVYWKRADIRPGSRSWKAE